MRIVLAALFIVSAQCCFSQTSMSSEPQSSVPVLQGCEHIGPDELQVCFNRKIMQHIMDELVWPEGLNENGKVIVEVVYDSDGTLKEIKPLRSYDPLAEAEALRVMKTLPRAIKPAMENGKPVPMSFKIPVQFASKQN